MRNYQGQKGCTLGRCQFQHAFDCVIKEAMISQTWVKITPSLTQWLHRMVAHNGSVDNKVMVCCVYLTQLPE